MKYILKSILAGSIGMFAYASVAAQDFDVTSQKGEQQIILPVPGKKVNHQGIIINPTPQQCLWDKSKHLDLSNGVSLRDIQGKFSNDIGFITSHAKGVKLTIDFGEKVSAKKGVKAVSGAYVMSIGKEVSPSSVMMNGVRSTVSRRSGNSWKVRWQKTDSCLMQKSMTIPICLTEE